MVIYTSHLIYIASVDTVETSITKKYEQKTGIRYELTLSHRDYQQKDLKCPYEGQFMLQT